MPASFSYAQPSEANNIVGGDVEQLKQRWPLLDYLQQQNWASRPAGYDSEFVGLCPLHQETRPSFYVNARKNLFYCHGCGQGGDLIRFVELSRHLSFRQSLAYLAQQSAPPVDPVDSATVLNEVAAFYQEQLDRYPEPLRYQMPSELAATLSRRWPKDRSVRSRIIQAPRPIATLSPANHARGRTRLAQRSPTRNKEPNTEHHP